MEEVRVIQFTVYGKAAPAGSKRAFHRGGKTMVVDASNGSRPWKQEITGAAIEAMEGPPLEGPLAVEFEFFVARPAGHYGKRGLLPSAPEYPTTRPDLLKLARAVEDAMTGVVYRDDSRIVVETLRKHYGEPARVEVRVRALLERSYSDKEAA